MTRCPAKLKELANNLEAVGSKAHDQSIFDCTAVPIDAEKVPFSHPGVIGSDEIVVATGSVDVAVAVDREAMRFHRPRKEKIARIGSLCSIAARPVARVKIKPRPVPPPRSIADWHPENGT